MVSLKNQAIKLRKKGLTYSEIVSLLNVRIPKGTLSFWCKNLTLPNDYQKKIKNINKLNLEKARVKAIEAAKTTRQKQIDAIKIENGHLLRDIQNINVAKIALAMLYLGEGSKNRKRGSLSFGNSDPKVITLFMDLMHKVYKLDESKFRCTLLCRADQDIEKLEKLWSSITKIPLAQFYKAQIDPRTIGKPTKKIDYKGVCKIDYFSAKIFAELLEIPNILTGL